MKVSISWFAVGLSLQPVLGHVANAAETPAKVRGALVQFSPAHGLFTNRFKLSLAAPEEATIYYTTNCATPGTNSLRYQGALNVEATIAIRAMAVATDGKAGPTISQTYLFPADIIKQSPTRSPPPGWPAQWGQGRAHYGMDERIINDPKLVPEELSALRSLPSYSLVVDPDDLWNPRRGLYSVPEAEGRKAERPVSLELILPDGGPGFQANCGARIRGGVSSGSWNVKHGFRFFFRKEYGRGHLEYPIFGPTGPKILESFDLRTEQNHSWHMEDDPGCLFVRDQFSRDLQAAMGQPAAKGDFALLYLNGQFWGLFDTCERPEASFAAAYFGGSKTNYDVIKTHGVGGDSGRQFILEATDGNDAAWKRLHSAVRAGLAENTAYFGVQGRRPDGSPDPQKEVLLDATNLIDYMLLIFYAGNYDAPVTKFFGNTEVNNFWAIRRRDGRDGFRWFAWDFEHALLELGEDRTGPFPPVGASINKFNPQWLFEQCLENPEFRQLTADRIQKHFYGNGALTPAMTRKLCDRRLAEVKMALILESARWGDASHSPRGPAQMFRIRQRGEPYTRDVHWRAEVQRMREQYFPKRTGVVLRQMKARGWVAELSAPVPKRNADGTIELTGGDGELLCATGTDPRLVRGMTSPAA